MAAGARIERVVAAAWMAADDAADAGGAAPLDDRQSRAVEKASQPLNDPKAIAEEAVEQSSTGARAKARASRSCADEVAR
jgi:hypothetical protein